MDGEEKAGEAEHHEEGAEETDEDGFAEILIGEDDEGDDAADHATDDPEETADRVGKTGEADGDGGNAVNESVAGEQSDMYDVIV